MKTRLVWVRLSQLRLPPTTTDVRPWLWREIGMLADDIVQHGLVNAPVVKYDHRRRTYTIFSGVRRYLACKILGMSKIQCQVVEKIEYLTFNLAESRLRSNTTKIPDLWPPDICEPVRCPKCSAIDCQTRIRPGGGIEFYCVHCQNPISLERK